MSDSLVAIESSNHFIANLENFDGLFCKVLCFCMHVLELRILSIAILSYVERETKDSSRLRRFLRSEHYSK